MSESLLESSSSSSCFRSAVKKMLVVLWLFYAAKIGTMVLNVCRRNYMISWTDNVPNRLADLECMECICGINPGKKIKLRGTFILNFLAASFFAWVYSRNIAHWFPYILSGTLIFTCKIWKRSVYQVLVNRIVVDKYWLFFFLRLHKNKWSNIEKF